MLTLGDLGPCWQTSGRLSAGTDPGCSRLALRYTNTQSNLVHNSVIVCQGCYILWHLCPLVVQRYVEFYCYCVCLCVVKCTAGVRTSTQLSLPSWSQAMMLEVNVLTCMILYLLKNYMRGTHIGIVIPLFCYMYHPIIPLFRIPPLQVLLCMYMCTLSLSFLITFSTLLL